MLSLLSTILAWDDTEREKAGLQRIGASAGSSSAKSPVEKKKGGRGQERSAEEEAAMNEVSSFVILRHDRHAFNARIVLLKSLCGISA